MTINPVIKPDVMNILSRAPDHIKKCRIESSPLPKAKPSKWDKVKGFIKKTWVFISSALVIIPPVLNAISRFREASKRPHWPTNNKGSNGGRDGRGNIVWSK